MLHFLRKYQKVFFAIITCVVIVSFVFFGTYSAFLPEPGRGKSEEFFAKFCRFLAYEGRGKDLTTSNFFNDFFVTREIIESGLAAHLFAKEPLLFTEELSKKLVHERLFSPYAHPRIRELSVASIWQAFAPDTLPALRALQACQSADTPESFQARVALFLQEKTFPPAAVSYVLGMKLQQFSEKEAFDPKLLREGFSLFGYSNLEDWFGAAFLERSAKLVLKLADIAKKEGYKVTLAECRSHLLYESRKVCSMAEVGEEEFLALFMRAWGLDEETLLKMKEKLLLCQKLLSDLGQGVLLDPLVWEDVSTYASEAFRVKVLQMPEVFCFSKKEELRLFEAYLAALGGSAKGFLLPEEISPKSYLYADRYTLQVATIAKKSLLSRVSVSESWAWEEAHLAEISERFPEAKGSPLANLSTKVRNNIDSYARKQIVESHPEWIEEALARDAGEEKILWVTQKGAKISCRGIHKGEELAKLLAERDELASYTEEGEHFSRIRVKERAQQRLVTFAEAKELALLQEGSDNSFDELLKALAQKYKVAPEVAYKYRFAAFLESAQETTAEHLRQFTPLVKEVSISRGYPEEISYELVESCPEGICPLPEEGVLFYRLLGKKEQMLPVDKLRRSSELLGREVKLQFLKGVAC